MNEEISLASSAVSSSGLPQACLIEKVGKKQTASPLERGQCLAGNRSGVGNIERKLRVFWNAKDSVWVLRQLGHGEEEIICVVRQDPWIGSFGR